MTRLDLDEILATLRDDPDICLVFNERITRQRRAVVFRQGGRLWRMPRWLYAQLHGEEPPGYLVNDWPCRTIGCQNPNHHRLTTRPGEPGRPKDRCPRGHAYTPGNIRTTKTGPKCRRCNDARLAKRRITDRRAGWCGAGHRLTDRTAYVWTDKDGHPHRRCRRCARRNMRQYRRTHRKESP